MLEWDSTTYADLARAFGWRTFEVDGHDVAQIHQAYQEAEAASAPAFIVARTVKGKGSSITENKGGFHGAALKPEQAEAAIQELGGERSLSVTLQPPAEYRAAGNGSKPVELPVFSEGIATRKAYGETLAALSARPDIVVLDAEVGNSTFTEDFEKVAPERFVQMYIAEQNMVGAAIGLQVLGKTPFAATFGAFLTRAYDFVRMGAVSRARLALCGSHAGVSIGEDGPSQMALEDLAMMRAVHGSTVLYPSDGNSTAQLVGHMADLPGISYIRTTREKTDLLYDAGEKFPIGGSKTLRSSPEDKVTLVGAGITVFECLKAADILAAEGIPARVIDAYSVKPIDAKTLGDALAYTRLMAVVEDHWVEGGLGDAVLAALTEGGNELRGRVIKIGVTQMPGSGKPDQLRDWAGISAAKIADRVRPFARLLRA
jgi:transketolase